MSDRSRYYILGSFLLGVALTTAYNKTLSAASSDDQDSKRLLQQQQALVSKYAKSGNLDTLNKLLADIEGGRGNIKEGIEGCIGDTPLIKIKSLSEYTGCDIFAKAEAGQYGFLIIGIR
jgi:cysteine synthase A